MDGFADSDDAEAKLERGSRLVDVGGMFTMRFYVANGVGHIKYYARNPGFGVPAEVRKALYEVFHLNGFAARLVGEFSVDAGAFPKALRVMLNVARDVLNQACKEIDAAEALAATAEAEPT